VLVHTRLTFSLFLIVIRSSLSSSPKATRSSVGRTGGGGGGGGDVSAFTFTVTVRVTEPLSPVQVREKVFMLFKGPVDSEPETILSPLQSCDARHEFTFSALHESVEDSFPCSTTLGFAVKISIGEEEEGEERGIDKSALEH
jgi:hypothetical protein